MDLITVGHTQVGKQEQQTTNARDLHTFLEVGRDFSTWIKGRIDQYGFVENTDFVKVETALNPSIGGLPQTGESENTGLGEGLSLETLANTGPRRIDYYLSMDMAKELSMVEANAKGKQARDYFIACETKLKEAIAQRAQEVNERLMKLEAVPKLYEAKRLMETKAERDFRDGEKLQKQSEKLSREYGKHYTKIMNKLEEWINRVHERTHYKHMELRQALILLDGHARFDDEGSVIPR